jgi:hypothetical protein
MPLDSPIRRLVLATVPARPVGVFRAAVGLAAVLKTTDFAAQLLMRDEVQFARHTWLGEAFSTLWPLVLFLWLFAGAALLVGFASRIAAGLVTCLSIVFVFGADFYSNHLYFLATLSFFLMFADSGATLSVDSRIKGVRETIRAWPVRLIQFQVSLVYGFSALGKVNGDFLLGNVIYYRLQDALIPIFAVISVTAVLVELFIAVALWIRRLQPAAFGLGLALHTSMIVMLTNTPQRGLRLALFALLSLSSYVLFLRPGEVHATVSWDQQSPFLTSVVVGLRRLDWLRALQFRASGAVSPDEGIRGRLQLQRSSGETLTDFHALTRILGILPLTFLWSPYLRFALLRKIGTRVLGRLGPRSR